MGWKDIAKGLGQAAIDSMKDNMSKIEKLNQEAERLRNQYQYKSDDELKEIVRRYKDSSNMNIRLKAKVAYELYKERH